MFIPDLFSFKLLFIVLFINFLESVFKSSIIFFENGVLGCEIERIFSVECELEAAVSETLNTLISVIHSESNTACSFVMVNFHFLLCSVIAFENDMECAWLINNEIGGFVLIAKCMTTNNDWLFPSWD